MKRSELKKLIKPLVKECIKEELLASGLISGLIAEVMKGFQGSILKEAATPSRPPQISRVEKEHTLERDDKLMEHRKQLLSSIGRNSFNGVDVFEGVTPSMPEPTGRSTAGSPLADQDPGDPGVDISGIVSMGGKVWSQLIK